MRFLLATFRLVTVRRRKRGFVLPLVLQRVVYDDLVQEFTVITLNVLG